MLLRLLRRQLHPYRRALVAVVALQLVGTFCLLLLPSLNADIIDEGVAEGDTGRILHVGGIMLAVSVVQVLCTVAAVWSAARTAMGFGRDVRSALFAQVGSFSSREVAAFGAPSLITRGTNDVQQVQMLVLSSCTMLVTAPIMLVGGVLMAAREDLGLSWLLAVTVPALIAVVTLAVLRMVPGFRSMQGRIDAVNRVLREQITGIRVVRAFVREEHETARFDDANAELHDAAVWTGRWAAALFPLVMLILNLSSVAVLWFGAQRVEAGLTEVGALTAFLAYLVQILMSVMMAMFMLVMVPRAAVCAQRILEVLETTPSVVAPVDGVTQAPLQGELEFRDVEFRYPGASDSVLRAVSFTVRPGETTAVIGSTGSGKTTLVDLVPRLSDVSAGAVLVGGVDVRAWDPDALRSRIGLVPQKAFLFSGTVASNLRYARPEATDEELWEALTVAQATEFVAAMPGGLAAPVAQGGSNLSGGQRQRLAIARAVVRRPEVYLFDDSFSALDLGTDARLRRALRPVVAEAAVLVVAQRVSSIREATQIVVLEDGAVVGRGTHDELLAGCGTYREIVASQEQSEVAA